MRAPQLVEGIKTSYCTGAEFAVDGGWSAGEPSPIFVPPGAQLPQGAFS